MFNIGIIGCGTMSARMADAIKGDPDMRIAGVASRDRNKGKKFAKAHCEDAKVYTGYEKLAAAKDIDLIYIATPNTCHYENAITCIKEHKNVLIEKPFAMSKAEADSIFTEAKNRGIFVCEGMWPNFMPLHKKIKEWIDGGRIGSVSYINANLGYDLSEVKRLYDPVLGGGAYLDLGVYTTTSMYRECSREDCPREATGIRLISSRRKTVPSWRTSMSRWRLLQTRTEPSSERRARSSSPISTTTDASSSLRLKMNSSKHAMPKASSTKASCVR